MQSWRLRSPEQQGYYPLRFLIIIKFETLAQKAGVFPFSSHYVIYLTVTYHHLKVPSS